MSGFAFFGANGARLGGNFKEGGVQGSAEFWLRPWVNDGASLRSGNGG